MALQCFYINPHNFEKYYPDATSKLPQSCIHNIQIKSDETAQLLNKLYVNEVYLTGQNLA